LLYNNFVHGLGHALSVSHLTILSYVITHNQE